ncbi:Ig-like domain-containing protein [Flavobacterium sangjuense]|uniref:Ig-like domain-containing protein n=1 Tax=Flavobacterium sangjuense TaxID=2518177 RepID=A0A4P7PW22_9FLAO|nr:GEVED domain-containing protein [Flavobacterium sangjuense]QBZ99006.1 hypothetical protein GS03_02518 [Flavobacterium sangjuense]
MSNNYTKLNSSTSTWFKKAGQKNLFFMLFFMLFSFISVNAQVDVASSGGTPTASYVTLKGAFDAINTGTHTGTITIGISGNTTETATAVLNASGAGLANYTTIGISPTGGVARTISGAIAAGSPLIDLNGADNVTIDGLNIGGNALTISNTTVSAISGTSTIRFQADATTNTITNCSVLGSSTSAIGTNGGNIWFASGAITTGNDNNTISNCNIGPAGVNLPSKCIYFTGTSNTHPGTANSGIVITNNNFFDYFSATVNSSAIDLNSGTATATITNNKFYQTATRTQTTTGISHRAITLNNGSGDNYTVTGNTIGYSSSAGTGTYGFVLPTTTSGSFIGIIASVGSTNATTISSNTITNIAISGGGSGTGTSAVVRGILVTGGLTTCNSNTIGSQSATGAITYTSNSTSASDFLGMFNSGSSNWATNNNNIGGITVSNSSTGAANLYALRCGTSSAATWTCTGNTIGGTVANSLSSTSTATGSIVNGITNTASAATITGNTIRNMNAAGGTGTTTSAGMAGIVVNASSANHTVGSNTIYNLSSTATGAATLNGVYFASSTGANVVEKNLIYDLNAASATSLLNGIFANAGNATYKNNMVRLGTFGTSATVGMAISGINENGGTNNVYNNSVYIGGAPATGALNSFAFQSVVTTNTRAFQNNIFVNSRSNSGSTGKHYAIRVGGTAANPAGLTSNYNILFANGTGGFTGLFNAVDQATIANWRSATGQDANSLSTNVPFLGATAATPNLHLDGSATLAEGLGLAIGTVTDDFDGETRSGLTPTDIGADALNAIAPSVVVINSVSASPSTTGLCTAVSRTITATTTAGGSPITSVTLNYAINGVAQTGIAMTGGSTTGTSDWTAVIPVASPVNAAITWSVTAIDPVVIRNTAVATYQDEPLLGATASATASPAIVCNGSTVTLTGIVSAPGSRSLGAGASTSSSSGASMFSGAWGGHKTQYIIRASELTAIGLGAGNITSLAFEATTAFNGYEGFAVNIGHTSATVAAIPMITTGLNQVYTGTGTNGAYATTIGVNTLTFSSPFNWDGVSNVVVQFCWAKNPAASSTTGTTVKVDTVSFTCTASGQKDQTLPPAFCPLSTSSDFGTSTTGTSRPKFTFAGQVTAPITTYSWVDNTTSLVVGTTNPLTITPTSGTTYTVTASTAGGCSATATTNAITVQALPSAPNATNGFRCGTGLVPSATVASTTGLPSPIFRWYADLTGGTALQSSTSTSYTTSITDTKTFYVTEFNGTCESSPRTAITLTVNPPPTITITTTTGNQVNCGSGSFNVVLHAASGDPGMTYSWTTTSGTAVINSGAGTADLNVTVTQSADFIVTGIPTDTACAPVVKLFPVSVYPLPVATVTTTASGVCPGTSATINSGLSAGNFTATCLTPVTTLSTPPAGAVTLINAGVINVTQNSATQSTDDGFWNAIPLGFSFNYFGTLYTTVNASTNGAVNFGAAGSTQFNFSGGFPNTGNPANMIALAARDLNAVSGSIKYWTEGNAPNRRFVIQYNSIPGYVTATTGTGNNSVEGIFYETLGTVDIRVISSVNGTGGTTNTNTKYIGLQDGTRTIGATAPNCSTLASNYWNGVTAEVTTPQTWKFSPPSNYYVTWSTVSPSNVLTTIGTANTLNNFSLTVSPGVTTVYDLRYTNTTTGCTNIADSNRVTMTIINNVAPSTTAVASATTICFGDSSNLSLTGNVNSIGNTDGLAYQWQVSTDGGANYTNIDGATSATTTVTPSVASKYKCLVTACNAIPVPSSEVSIGFANSVTVTPSTGRCGLGTVDLYATASAGDVKWYASASGGTALFTGSPYTPTLNTTTTYYAAAETTGPACSSARVPLVVNVTTPPSLTISQTSPATICSGTSQAITLVGGGAYNTFSWSSPLTVSTVTPGVSYTLAPTTNNNYVLTASQSSGQQCVTTVPFSVNVNTVVVSANTSASPICIGTSATLTADPSVAIAYAASTATNTADTEIFNVTFGSINNTSDCGTTGGGASEVNLYSDYTALSPAVVAQGATIPLSVSIGTCDGNYDKFLNVFIDYNRDGDFNDAGERVYSSSAVSNAPQVETGSVLIPATASLGTTRMRVMLQEGATDSSSPSGTYTYGETEDYSITITGTTSRSYSWSVVGNPAVISTAQTFSVSPTTTTVYRVTVTDPVINCSNYTDVTVAVNSNPINPLSGGATSICLGTPTIPASIDFNSVDGIGTPTAGLQWTSSNVAVATIDNDGVLTPLTAGTTTVGAYIYNSSTGCTTYSPNTIVVNVYNPIVKTSEPVSQTILPTTNTSFTVAATGSNVQYQWYSSNNNTIFTTPVVNSAIISGAGTNVLTITGATLAMNGTYYRCAITGSSPCASPIFSDPVLLTVQNLSITNPVSQSICNTANTASFSVTTAGPAPDYFIWEYNDGTGWVTIEDQSQLAGNISFGGDVFTNTLVVNDIILTNTTWQFRANAVIESTGDIATSSPATLTVSQPATIPSTPANQTVCYIGGSANFTVSASNAVSYQWQFSSVGGSNPSDWTTIGNPTGPTGITYSGFTSNQLGLAVSSDVSPVVNYYYRAIAVSASPCDNSQPSAQAQLIINNPNVAIATPDGTVSCGGALVALNASGATTYTWSSVPASVPALASAASISVAPTVNTLYTVNGTTAGCTKSASVNVTVSVATVATATPSAATVCPGAAVQLTAAGVQPTPTAANLYTFTNNPSPLPTLDPMTGSTQLLASALDDTASAVTPIGFTFNFAGTNYTQFSANVNGLLRLGSTAVTTSFSNTAANAGTNTPAIMPYFDDLSTGTNGKVHYVVTGSAPNRILTVEWFVVVPRSTATGGTAAAKFQAKLYEGTNVIDYVYGPGMVVNTANSGASIGIATSSTVYNNVVVTTNLNSTTTFTTNNTAAIPSGQVYRFAPGNLQTYSYLWTALTPDPTLTNTTSAIASANPTAASTTYQVVVTSNTGCKDTKTVTVTTESGVNNFVQPVAQTFCAGQTATLSASASGAGLVYTWYKVGTPASVGTGATLSFPSATTAATGDYNVVVTATCGPGVTSNTVHLQINPLPTATISGTVTKCQNDPVSSVTFTGSNGTAPYTFIYSLNGGADTPITSNLAGIATIVVPTGTATSYNYTLKSVSDSSATACSQSQTGTATILVNPVPSNVTASASLSPVCVNSFFNLTSSASPIAGGFAQNFDSVTAPALPAGWASTVTGEATACVTRATGADTAPNTAFIADVSTVSDKSLSTPVIPIGSTTAQLTFRHSYTFEGTTSFFDGGVLEIKIGAGAYTDIVTAGGSFVTNGYNGTISTGFSNPLGGRSAWCNTSSGYKTVTVNLPAAAAGQNIQLRWRLGSDTSTGSTGWSIDTVSLVDVVAQTYSWESIPTGFTSSLQNPTGLNATQNTTYKVTVTTSAGCKTSATTDVVADQLPVATTSGSGSKSICSNATYTLTSGEAAANYGTILWTVQSGLGSITAGSTTVTPQYTAVAADAGTDVTLLMTVTSNNTCATTATATYTLHVDPLPTASTSGSGTKSICAYSSYTLTASEATASYGTILWTVQSGAGSITAGSTTLTPKYTPVNADAGTNVTLLMTVTSNNACGTATATATYTFYVYPIPTVSTILNNISYYSGFATAAISLTGTPAGVTFNITGGAAAGLADVPNVNTIPSFIPTPITTPTTVTVTPVANGCTGVAKTYQLIPIPVVANITSSHCGTVNNGLNNQIQAGNVSVPGYTTTGYRFEVTNTATGEVAYVDTVQSMFKLTDTSIYAYGTTFAIRVAVILNGHVQGFFGNTCTLTTASVQTTKVVTAQCGATLAAINSNINANSVSSTNLYRFRVALASAPTTYYLLERSVPNFNLSMVAGLPLTYETEYKVDVQIRVKLAGFEAWSQFGAVCSIFTPEAPTTSLTIDDCELVATSYTQAIHIIPYPGATSYRVLLTGYDENGDVNYSQFIVTTSTTFTLSQFTGLSPDTAYSVEVAINLFGNYTPYGKTCSVTTPGTAPATKDVITFRAVAYPNPFANNFMIDVKSSSQSSVNLKVYDMIGRLVEQRDVRVSDLVNSAIGERYPSGVYNVVVSQDESVQTVRVVKR